MADGERLMERDDFDLPALLRFPIGNTHSTAVRAGVAEEDRVSLGVSSRLSCTDAVRVTGILVAAFVGGDISVGGNGFTGSDDGSDEE